MRARITREDQMPMSKERRLLHSSIRSKIRDMAKMLSPDKKISTIKSINIIAMSNGANV